MVMTMSSFSALVGVFGCVSWFKWVVQDRVGNTHSLTVDTTILVHTIKVGAKLGLC